MWNMVDSNGRHSLAFESTLEEPALSTPYPPNSPNAPEGHSAPSQPSPGYTQGAGAPSPTYGDTSTTAQLPDTRPYPQQTYQSAAPAAQKPQLPTTMAYTNTFAVLAIIFAFISPLAGIIFGHLALGQIKRNGDAGRGIGLTGLIISYAYFVFIALFFIIYIGFIIVMFGAMGAAFSEMGSLDSDFDSGTF